MLRVMFGNQCPSVGATRWNCLIQYCLRTSVVRKSSTGGNSQKRWISNDEMVHFKAIVLRAGQPRTDYSGTASVGNMRSSKTIH